jgi:hypothetical protein
MGQPAPVKFDGLASELVAITYRINAALGLTTSVWDGSVTGQEARNHLLRLAADRDWPPGPLQLSDLTTLREAAIPDEELVDLLHEGANLYNDTRIVLVLRPEMLYPPKTLRNVATMLFTDLDRASRFLDVDEATVRAMVDEARNELRAAGSV